MPTLLWKGWISVRDGFDPTHTPTTDWCGPKVQQNKMDKFLSIHGVNLFLKKFSTSHLSL